MIALQVPPGMEESNKSEAHLTSAAAFVEGGIQEACDDTCSICLEAFCDSDPSTVCKYVGRFVFSYMVFVLTDSVFYLQLTGCKHEFHLQCILEWYFLIFIIL